MNGGMSERKSNRENKRLRWVKQIDSMRYTDGEKRDRERVRETE